LKTKLNQIYDFWVSEATHYLQMSAEVGIARNICTKLRSILSQQYSGDITILPDLSEVARLGKMLSNPTPQYLLHCTMKGARSTWPKIGIIKNHCGLEFALDSAIKLLRSRNFKNLRSSNIALVNSPNFTTEIETSTRPSTSDNLIDNISLSQNRSTANKMPSDAMELALKGHHNRHRSETMNVSKLRHLRSSKSHIFNDQTHVSSTQQQQILQQQSQQRELLPQSMGHLKRNRSFKGPTKYQRSWSASNEVAVNFNSPGINDFSLPSSEAQSPLSFNVNNDEYFKKSAVPVKSSPIRKNAKLNFSDAPVTGLRSSRNSSFSLKNDASLAENLNGKPFLNIDSLDGLFGPVVSGEALYADDDDDTDPVKVDEHISNTSG
jgi:hypothetical protein